MASGGPSSALSRIGTMRLLYLAAHQTWPLTSGNRLRDYYLARELAKRASVTYVEMYHSGEGPSRAPSDSGFEETISVRKGTGYTPDKIVRGIVGPIPLTVLNYFRSRSASQLANLLRRRRFDTVQLEGVQLSNYLRVIQAVPDPAAILVDWHNIESELMWRYSENESMWAKRMVARRTAALLQRTEKALLEGCRAHTVVSERERKKLLSRSPSANLHVIPNGVDTDFFSPNTIAQLQDNARGGVPRRSILFVGSMDYHANIDAALWFAREVWPTIAQKYPELELNIVGRHPTSAVQRLASERVRISGTVEDVRPFYASSIAVVVPLRVGSGTRLKILEAMAAGVPVVSTSLGAEGLDATHDVHLLVANTEREIIAALDRILGSAETSARLTGAARDLVVRLYDWTAVGEQLYGIHSNLVRSSPQSVTDS
jgi:sugar transferase (PEP-CTERM/EpsH1 system associated)